MGATETIPIVFDDAAPLFAGAAHTIVADKFDANVAAQALDAAGITDPVNRKLHITALKRAIGRAARA
jgi:carbon-monoxide dehydrogenase medium subunit